MTLCKITTTGLLSYVFDPENKQFLRMTCHHCFVLLHFRKKIGEVRIIRRALSGLGFLHIKYYRYTWQKLSS